MASKSKRNRQRRKRKEALLAAPNVAVTVAVSAPDKEKKMGGGIMVPPEREEMAEGGIGDLLPETETYLKNKKILGWSFRKKGGFSGFSVFKNLEFWLRERFLSLDTYANTFNNSCKQD